MGDLQFSGTGDLAAWVSLAFTVVAGVAASGVYFALRRRERRQALTELHASLTSGETAQARNTIGTLLYSDSDDDKPNRLESIEAYFALIWALQRARNVFRTYRIHWTSLNAPQSRLSHLMRTGSKDASLALTWNLVEIAQNVARFHDLYGEKWAIEDDDAWGEISTYVDGGSVTSAAPLPA